MVSLSLLTVFAAACGSPSTGTAQGAHAKSSATSTPLTATPTNETTTTDSQAGGYDPSYSTVQQLVDDSVFIVLGTLHGGPAGPFKMGSVTYYPINWQRNLGLIEPRETIGVSSSMLSTAKLAMSGTYVFFYAVQGAPLPPVACIVGGLRGVMAYDPTSGTVTRLDNDPSSQIPRTESLTQLVTAIQRATQAAERAPVQQPPQPVCSPSATGLASG